MRGKRAAAVCLVALVALSGCTDKSDKSAENGAVASAAPTVEASDPATAFKAAVTKTNQATMTFTIDADLGTLGSQKASGAADPKAKATGYHSDLTLSGRSVTIDAILVGSDLYLKVPGVTSGDRWAHMDMTKVKSLSKLGLDASGNPTNLGTLDAEVVAVTRTAPGAYSGTLDRTKNPVVAGAGGVSEALKSVPFEATVNPQGYVTSLVIHTPPVGSGPASTSTSKFADFAQPIAIERPDSAEVQQAPDELYQALQ
ncbi:LolA-like protein [Dactylosporangium darangshiense]|uniref:Lipoprotein n=1 Tax=Dactylosporangium darangshiense TaxID=579108 RepID=A0ABP8DT50_9ACTN